jgi:hypothetical protein
MTEQEWLACADPRGLLEYLRGSGTFSERKVRLFVAACCRGDWPLMPAEGDPQGGGGRGEIRGPLRGGRDLRAAVAAAWKACCRASPKDPHHDRAWAAYALACTAGLRELTARMWGGGCWGNLSTPERAAHAHLLHCIWGNPFRPVTLSPGWQTPQVVALAQAAYDQRELPAGTLDAARLAVLADGLEDAGCTEVALLDHLRGPGPHVRGCWAVDLILGKALTPLFAVRSDREIQLSSGGNYSRRSSLFLLPDLPWVRPATTWA